MKRPLTALLLILSSAALVIAQSTPPATTPAASTSAPAAPPAGRGAGFAGGAGRGGGRGGGGGPNYDAFYKLGPDSLPQDGVPKGKFIGPTTLPSKAFPGTQHTYFVHVPAQYDPSKPACLMVFNDGQAFMNPNSDLRAQNVLDNLMWRREIPVIISIFINPGRTPEQPEPSPAEWGDRTANRGPEYNRIEDKYPSVVCDEVLPEVMKLYNISPNPDDHGIGGASSGGIAAFTVAWHRPNTFRKVFTIVGSFVNLSGGQGSTYPDLIAANDKKPIRIFLQDGVNDNRNADLTRDWHYQNARMVEALTKKGYDVNYTFGIGLHGQKQGGAILPDMLRWLWRDYPRPYDSTNTTERSFRAPVTQPQP